MLIYDARLHPWQILYYIVLVGLKVSEMALFGLDNSLSNLDRIRSEVKAGQKRILSRPC